MINLILIDRERPIKSASLSGQCAKHYFYGKDFEFEKALSELEGLYAEAIRRVEHGTRSFEMLNTLRDWSYFQYQRTDAARRKHKRFYELMNQAIADARWQTDPSDEALVRDAMLMFFNTVGVVRDLRSVIICNRSDTEFVSSDAPSIIFNKWLDQKLNIRTFGLSNSGLCIYMPLTPRLAVLSYDAQVYRIDGIDNGEIQLRDGSEAESLNSLQICSDALNIYFRDWESREALLKQIREQKTFKSEGVRVTVMVPEINAPGTYRALKEGENEKDFDKSVIHSESIFPKPPRWFGFLKNKIRPKFFENGTAVGRVRKREWLNVEANEFRPPRQQVSSTRKVLPGLPGNPFD